MAKKQGEKKDNEIAFFFFLISVIFLKKFQRERRHVIAITNISCSVPGFVLNALHTLTHLILIATLQEAGII